MKAKLIERKIYTEDGAKLYNVLKVGTKEKDVFIGTIYPNRLSKSEADKVYAIRNNPIADYETNDKVDYEFDVKDKQELHNKVYNKAYDEYIERKFLSFIDDLDDNDFSSTRGMGGTSTSRT